jgi:hypothetical protein
MHRSVLPFMTDPPSYLRSMMATGSSRESIQARAAATATVTAAGTGSVNSQGVGLKKFNCIPAVSYTMNWKHRTTAANSNTAASQAASEVWKVSRTPRHTSRRRPNPSIEKLSLYRTVWSGALLLFYMPIRAILPPQQSHL